MILDFNFQIKNSAGRELGFAKDTLIMILEGGSNNDERYLDKIEKWTNDIEKSGQIKEIDVVDAKELKQMVIRSGWANNVSKIPIKNFIQKRIDLSEVNKDKKGDK